MKHARPDYDRIQDPANKIPEDEPVFLIRGQDVTSARTLRYWAAINQEIGGDPQLIEQALDHADLMQKWINKHGKIADL